jgi:type IV pilus assembly protein PilM
VTGGGLFGSESVRTGIDLGTTSVKLVRGTGAPQLARITHIGLEPWDGDEAAGDEARAAGALERLMQRLGLHRNSLGRVAVALTGESVGLREALLPRLAEADLARALPFEARKHLNLDEMTNPILHFQILGPADSDQAVAQDQIRVLFAAAPRARREFPLRVLTLAGIEPEVIDAEPLASLNALFSKLGGALKDDRTVALLDLGARRTTLQISRLSGGIFYRAVGPGAPGTDAGAALAPFVRELAERIGETVTFYRGKQRREVSTIYAAGGGALLPGLAQMLGERLDGNLAVLDPLDGLASRAKGIADAEGAGPRFVTACGLCRWWDEADV